MVKEHLFVTLFETFIKETANGKRRKQNGERIKPQTVENYTYVLKLLLEYEQFYSVIIRVKTNIKNNERLLMQEGNYWKNFYRKFSDFLYYEKGYYDNFTGSVFKVIKSVFNYFKKEKWMTIQNFYTRFYVREENINIITLLPEQLCFLIMDKDFESKLNWRQRRSKDMFVFGCTTALRFSDLINICIKDIVQQPHGMSLQMKSQKTATAINIKLPDFACDIFKKYAKRKGPRQKVFGPVFLSVFNDHLKKIGELAGWTNFAGKYRSKNGRAMEIKSPSGKLLRFCD